MAATDIADPVIAPTVAVGRATRDRALVALFTGASLLGSSLLFFVQPLIGRQLLPLAGGTPNLWNTAMVFFQAVLLAGYLFAHHSTRRLGAGTHAVVQVSLLALPLLILPVAVPDGWSLVDRDPVLATLAVLAVMVGLPFFALSTSSPTLQRWFSLTDHPSAADPYFLYAAGNVGSLAALVAYPFLVEPHLSLADQARWWAVGYGAFVVVSAGCALSVRRRPGRALGRSATLSPPVAVGRRARWVFWAMVPSALMLSVTRHLTADVASFPLLWIIPLVLYLLTFIVAFGARADRLLGPTNRLVRLGVIPLAMTFVGRLGGIGQLLLVHLGWFLAAALLAHLRLSHDRPPADRLTEFYAWISVGGVVGGAFIALLAPLAFDRVLEYPIVVGLALLVTVPAEARRGRARVGASAATLAALLALVMLSDGRLTSAALLVAAAGLVGLRWLPAPRSYAALVGATVVLATLVGAGTALHRDRSFFGVYAVREDGNGFHELTMGTTVHGRQEFGADGPSRTPASYYHRSGPLGTTFADLAPGAEIGVVGLGAGEIAAHGRAGDRVTFYEIDPTVVEIASDPELFTYLRDTAAEVEIIVGDGRLALEADQRRYDVLLVDAFSSDAIPVHLMTVEAVGSYLDHVEDGGVLMMHVSNRFFDLRPVVGTIANELGVEVRVQTYVPDPEARADGAASAIWMALAPDPAALAAYTPDAGWSPAPVGGSLWTDDHAHVLGALMGF